MLAAGCTPGPGEAGTEIPDIAEPVLEPPRKRDDAWLRYPDDFRPADQGSFSEPCEAALLKMPFRWRASTHILVARYKVDDPALAADSERLQTDLVDPIKQSIHAALAKLPLTQEAPGTTAEVVPLACTIETRDEALRIAEAAQAHIVVWGDLSRTPPERVTGEVDIKLRKLDVGPDQKKVAEAVDPGGAYYVHSTITLYDAILGVGSTDAGQELAGLGQYTSKGDPSQALTLRLRLALAINLIQRGSMWLAEQLLADPAVAQLFAEVTRGREEIRHMYLAQLYLSMGRVERAGAELEAARKTGKGQARTMFGAQLLALRGNFELLKGRPNAAIKLHEEALASFRTVVLDHVPLHLLALFEKQGKGRTDFVTWAVAPMEMLIGIDYMVKNDSKTAERRLTGAVATMQSNDVRHPLLPMAQTHLGTLYLVRGEGVKAVKLAESARDNLDAANQLVLPGAHLRQELHLDTHVTLARAYLATGQAKKASAAAADIMDRAVSLYGEVHPITLYARSAQASVYDALGRPGDAIAIRKGVLTSCEALRGDTAIQCRVDALNALGMAYVLDGQWDLATEKLEEAAKLHEKLHKDPLHPGLWAIRNNLARVASDRGDPALAVTRYKQALAMLERGKSTGTEAYASVLSNLATVELELDHKPQAVEMLQRVLKLRKQLTKKSGDTATLALAYNNLATAQNSVGDHQSALRNGNEALRLAEASFGKEHKEYASIATNLAAVYMDLGDEKRAEQLFAAAERGLQGASSYAAREQAVRIVNNRGVLFKASKQFDAALAAFQRARTMARAADLPPDNDLVHTIDGNIAVELYNLKRYDEARQEASAALDNIKRKFNGKHSKVADLQWVLGEIALIQGRPQEAIQYLADAANYMRTNRRTDSVRNTTLFALARAYQQVGDVTHEMVARDELLQVALATPGPQQADEVAWARFNIVERVKASQPDRARAEWEAMVRDGSGATASLFAVIAAHQSLAELHHARGDHPAEAALLQKGISLATTRGHHNQAGTLHEALGDCHHAQGQLPAALAAYEAGIAAVLRDKEPAAMSLSHLHYDLGEVLVASTRPADAVLHYAEAEKLAQGLGKRHEVEWRLLALLNLSRTLSRLDRHEEAHKAASTAHAIVVDSVQRRSEIKRTTIVMVDHQLAHTFQDLGDHVQALAAARRALAGSQAVTPTSPGAQANIQQTIANSLAALKDFAGSEAALRDTLASLERASAAPEWRASTHTTYAALLRHQRRHDEAIAQYEQALQRAPNYTPAALGLANVLISRGEFKRSSTLVQGVLAAKEVPQPQQCEALMLQMTLADRKAQWDAVLAAVRPMLTSPCRPRDLAGARWFAMNAMFSQSQFKSALAQYTQIVGAAKELPADVQRAIHLTAARAYQSTDRRAEAGRAFASALAIAGDDPSEAKEASASLYMRYAAHLGTLGRATDARAQMAQASQAIKALAGTEAYPHLLAFAAGVHATIGDLADADEAEAQARKAMPKDAKQADHIQDQLTVARAVRTGWRLLGPNQAVLVTRCIAPRCQRFKPGDRIVGYAGRPITSPAALRQAVAQTEGQAGVPVDVVRDGAPMKVTVPGGLLGISLR